MLDTWLRKIALSPLFLLMGAAGEAGAAGAGDAPLEGAPAPGAGAGGEAAAPEGHGADATAGEREPAPDADAAGAPEEYGEFTIPAEAREMELVAEALEAFKPVAQEMGLPQEKAQLLFDRLLTQVHPRMEARRLEAWNGIVAGWADAARADREIGGERFARNVEVAQRALNTFGTPELTAALNRFGLGNHPELIRLMVRMGNAMREDSIVLPGSRPGGGKRSVADRLYGGGE
ncbi:peptidase [Oryzomonas sagensis]|uniref:Peptidase n=1 Tax=Oryzomonas sagensis TaxID=2603857 RepID=A0ABQ6TPK6_9BACT|nr:peptidase [Oryzomonas sagensis]KAB0670345.1 peptidase [Oryzomonas sagensis]